MDKTLNKNRTIVLLSPFLIIIINYIVAITFGKIIGKWAFIPIILIEWCLFMFFILRFAGLDAIKNWLKKPTGSYAWALLALLMGMITIPIFLKNYGLLTEWQIWLPWILLAMINPWIEEFYWRGLLLDYTAKWNSWVAILFSSLVFAANHSVFGVNADLFKGGAVFTSTLIMGIIWALVYKKTKSLRWTIIAHFFVDFLSLSAPAFLDLFKPGM
jgi:uncharacterized protein